MVGATNTSIGWEWPRARRSPYIEASPFEIGTRAGRPGSVARFGGSVAGSSEAEVGGSTSASRRQPNARWTSASGRRNGTPGTGRALAADHPVAGAMRTPPPDTMGAGREAGTARPSPSTSEPASSPVSAAATTMPASVSGVLGAARRA